MENRISLLLAIIPLSFCFIPKLHKILEHIPPSKCWLYLHIEDYGKGLRSENLEYTGQNPLSIKKQYKINKTQRRNAVFGQEITNPIKIRGWICDNVLLYLVPLFEKDLEPTLLHLLQPRYFLHAGGNVKQFTLFDSTSFILTARSKIGIRIIAESLRGLILTSSFQHAIQNVSILDFEGGQICVIHNLHTYFENLKCKIWNEQDNIFQHFDGQISNPDEFWTDFYSSSSYNYTSIIYLGGRTNFKNFNLQKYLLQLAAQKLNTTIDPFISGKMPVFMEEVTGTDVLNYVQFNHTIKKFTGMEGYTFVTCYTSSVLDFKMYATPFSIWVWVWLFCSLAISGIFVDVVWVLKTKKKELLLSILYFFGYLIDEAPEIPKNLSNMFFLNKLYALGSFLGRYFAVFTLHN